MCITNFLYKFYKYFMYILYKKNWQRNLAVRCLPSFLLHFWVYSLNLPLSSAYIHIFFTLTAFGCERVSGVLPGQVMCPQLFSVTAGLLAFHHA